MVTSGADPSGQLCAEVLAEGRRRAQSIQEEARREGTGILARASAQAEAARAETLAAARRRAEHERNRTLAGVPIEVARRRAAHVEALLDRLRHRALEELAARSGFDYREAILALAAEALERMSGEAFVLALAPADRAALEEGLADALRLRTGRPGLRLALVEDPSITGGGLILQDEAGTQVWDDRLSARLERLWPRLRPLAARDTGLLGTAGGAP